MRNYCASYRAATRGVLCLLWVVTAASACPEYCSCVLRKVDCFGRELKHVPDDIPLRTRYLHLGLTSIQNLPDAVFSNLTSLRGLLLRNNHIPRLPAGVFSHLSRLSYLYLSNNHIADLPVGIFSQLSSLNDLYLSNNDVADLPDGIFSNLVRLKWLELDNNSISSLPAGVFSRLNRLELLSMNNNGIVDLPDGVFSHLISLEKLYLSNNSITHLPEGVFSHIRSLRHLYLSNNDIQALEKEVFSSLVNLRHLYLNGNDIRDLPAEVFLNLTSLNRLSLSNNSISSLPKRVFSNLVNLTQLNLTDNKIEELPGEVFFFLTSLELLSLSNNSISRLPVEVFSHLNNLSTLHLSNNNMEDLPTGVFSNLTSLLHLFLSDNNISRLHPGLFTNLSRLISVDLRGNRLSDLPEGIFSHLSSLKVLILANNAIADLNDGVLSNQTGLKLLDLSNNDISLLSAGIFSHLNSLETLVLAHNGIQELPQGVFSRLSKLVLLRLGHNSIQNLTRGVFSALTRLQELDLSNNDLLILPAVAFSHLTSLTSLNLTQNSLQTLPADMSRLPRQTSLDLQGNPWRCDCRLLGLVLDSLRLRPQGLTCSTPLHLEGVALHMLMYAWTGAVCYNHGRCTAENTCDCFFGWTGPYCNIEVNVALGKTATQISNGNPYQGPEKAVDGYRGTSAGTPDNECAITQEEPQPWWKVDLADTYTVSRVSVLNRGDWQEERLRNFTVRVGQNENFTLNDQCGQTYTDTPTKAQTIEVRCEPPMSGRYVSVQIVGRKEFLTLCEVEVYITEICCSVPSIENGRVTGPRCLSQTVHVTCDPGYRLVGPASLQCLATTKAAAPQRPGQTFIQTEDAEWEGVWDDQLPTCEKVCCNATEITNGRVIANDGFCSGNVAMFSCDPGYELVGTLWATCRENGSYDQDIPTCQLICSTWWRGQNCQHLSASALGGISAAAALVVIVVIAAAMAVRLKMRGIGPKYSPVHGQLTFSTMSQMRADAPPKPQLTLFEVDPARLEICEKIGRGAFGVVSRALLHLDNETTREVAVKTFSASSEEEDKLSFLQEIRAVVDLGTHENLLGLIGCCTLVGDLMYLITEFMPHGDLKSFLGKCRDFKQKNPYVQVAVEGYYKSSNRIYKFQEKEMYKVSLQVAKGMDHIAKADYIHGDLAARNVLVGDNLQVKISDFGLADHIYSRGYRRQDRLRKIPWKWMAPERLTDGERYTSQSDVWSFGVMLYEIATLGGSPYPDVPTADLPVQLKNGYRMPQPADCPQPLYDLMLQCWRLDPEDRPFFHRLATELEKLFNDEVDLVEKETSV
ncbi:uncharacterized protein LOC144928212 isoform X1 [Branchiostoma floridae x Branchiostoma belcheri]